LREALLLTPFKTGGLTGGPLTPELLLIGVGGFIGFTEGVPREGGPIGGPVGLGVGGPPMNGGRERELLMGGPGGPELPFTGPGLTPPGNLGGPIGPGGPPGCAACGLT